MMERSLHVDNQYGVPQRWLDALTRLFGASASSAFSMPMSIEEIVAPGDLLVVADVLCQNPHAIMAVEAAVTRSRDLPNGSYLQLVADTSEPDDTRLTLVAWISLPPDDYRAARDAEIAWWRTRPIAARRDVILLPRLLSR